MIGAAFERALRENSPFTIEFRHLTAAREILWFELRAIVIPASESEPARFMGIGQNVTARKQAEQALREINETLEERVRLRTQQVQDLATALTIAEQEERQRVAQVLHDDLQQRLYSLLVRLQLLRKRWDIASDTPEQLEEIMTQLRDAVQVTRTLVTELNPPVLETEGLAAALHWLAEHMRQMYALSVNLEIRDDCEPYSVAVRTLLVQMARELLFNVVKHARTGEATLILEQADGGLRLLVEDRGVGFDLNSIAARPMGRGGYGLRSIKERLQLMGGRVDIQAVPGSGSRVTLWAPGNAVGETQQSLIIERA
jgi:signal transduction histidine kinase